MEQIQYKLEQSMLQLKQFSFYTKYRDRIGKNLKAPPPQASNSAGL